MGRHSRLAPLLAPRPCRPLSQSAARSRQVFETTPLPGPGLEPGRAEAQGVLSPLRLPVPPSRRRGRACHGRRAAQDLRGRPGHPQAWTGPGALQWAGGPELGAAGGVHGGGADDRSDCAASEVLTPSASCTATLWSRAARPWRCSMSKTDSLDCIAVERRAQRALAKALTGQSPEKQAETLHHLAARSSLWRSLAKRRSKKAAARRRPRRGSTG